MIPPARKHWREVDDGTARAARASAHAGDALRLQHLSSDCALRRALAVTNHARTPSRRLDSTVCWVPAGPRVRPFTMLLSAHGVARVLCSTAPHRAGKTAVDKVSPGAFAASKARGQAPELLGVGSVLVRTALP